MIDDPLNDAAHEYIDRQEGRHKPAGDLDIRGFWWPGPDERQVCCGAYIQPTTGMPMSLFHHCLSLQHISTKYRVAELDLIKFVDSFDALRR